MLRGRPSGTKAGAGRTQQGRTCWSWSEGLGREGGVQGRERRGGQGYSEFLECKQPSKGIKHHIACGAGRPGFKSLSSPQLCPFEQVT